MNEEKISDSMSLMLFLLGISGKAINFEKVARKYGEKTASQLKREIEIARVKK